MTRTKRTILLLVGFVSLGLGALGVILPLLPTTPFILLAAFMFANSSEKMHQWLLDHNVFGPLIDDWRRYGSIRRSAKIATVISVIAILGISYWLNMPTWVIAVQALVLIGVLAFVLSRPLPMNPTQLQANANQEKH